MPKSCPEAERAATTWSESLKGADTEEESALRTTSGMARAGLRVGDGHHSPSPCTGLPESAWLVETHTVSRSAKDRWTHLYPEVHFCFAEQIPNLGYCLTFQHPLPRPELLSRQKVGCEDQNSRTWTTLKERNLSFRPKEKTACKPVQGARPWTPLAIYVGHQGLAILKGCKSKYVTPWLGEWLVLWSVSSTVSSTKGTASCGATLEAAQGRLQPWGLGPATSTHGDMMA